MQELDLSDDPALNEAIDCAPDLCPNIVGLAEQCGGEMQHFICNHANLVCDRYVLSICTKCENKVMTAVIDD